jgi:5'(3')-deoxyribonucleotidase
MNLTCFLDMDGVLVDFAGAAQKLHGKILPPAEVKYDFWEQMGLTPDEFWAPIDADFWANLEWTAEGQELLEALERKFTPQNIIIMTSTSNKRGATDGKLDWIEKHIPQYSRRYLMGPTKSAAAARGKILVDDFQFNTTDFMLSGGHSVLVPRPWNGRRHHLDANLRFRVDQVMEDIDYICREAT